MAFCSRRLGIAALVFLLARLLFIPALADGGIVSGEAVKADAGGAVELDVSVSGNPGLAAYLVELEFNPAALSVADGEDDVKQGDFCADGIFVVNAEETGKLSALWVNANNVTVDGTLFTVSFTVAADAVSGTYPVTVRISEKNTLDEEGTIVPLTASDGSVDVKGADKPESGDGGEARPAPESGPDGEAAADARTPGAANSVAQSGEAAVSVAPAKADSRIVVIIAAVVLAGAVSAVLLIKKRGNKGKAGEV